MISRYAPLADHNDAFTVPPALPAPESVALAVMLRDPTGFYLARSAEIRLPRDFSAIDRRRLEAAVAAMLDQIE